MVLPQTNLDKIVYNTPIGQVGILKQDLYPFEKEFIEIGLKVGYYRRRRGLTQEQLADITNLSKSHISQIEAPSMAAGFSVHAILLIAKALDVPAYKFCMFDDIL